MSFSRQYLYLDRKFLLKLPKLQLSRICIKSRFHSKSVATAVNYSNKIIISYKFHSTPRRYFDPALWPIVRNILQGTGIISGRGVRKWWQSLPDEKQKYFVHSAKKRHIEVILLLGFIFVSFYIYRSTHLQEAPVTGRQRFIAFTDYQFNKIMTYSAEQLCNKLKDKYLPVNHSYYDIVINTLRQLVSANLDIKELKNIKWTIAVVDDPAVNAFVNPTGHVFVNRGLLEFVTDQDQLAFVLAHEMAHALLKHGAENLSRLQLIDYLIISGMTALWTLMPTDGIAIVTHWFYNKVVNVMLQLPHSRLLEEEADKVGLHIAAKACFDIRCGTVFWTLMDMHQTINGKKCPEWLSTHPASHKRAELFDCLLHKYIHIRHECRCPPLPEKDPRHELHHLKTKVENLVASRKSRANIERFKIPMPHHEDMHIVMSALDDCVKGRECALNICILPAGLGKGNECLERKELNINLTEDLDINKATKD